MLTARVTTLCIRTSIIKYRSFLVSWKMERLVNQMEKKKIRLLILAEDLSENSVKKMASAAEKHNVPCKIYGAGEQLSKITGNAGKGIFGITDENFAKVISDGIDHIQSEK